MEYPTIDGKSVDYAMKVNSKTVLLLEAKQLTDPLDDVKSITQVVGYAANDGIEWCVLTNGVRYKVYKASERASAPDKLLFEVSLDPRDNSGLSVTQIASQLGRLSRDSLAHGVLDKLGAETFTISKVRKALDHIIVEEPDSLIRIIRRTMDDSTVTPAQIQQALLRIWDGGRSSGLTVTASQDAETKTAPMKPSVDYSESHHTNGRPIEVVELYRALDRLCQDFAPGQITRAYRAKYVSWALDKAIFCCAHLQQSGLRVWIKIDPKSLNSSQTFARDVSKIGHWGVGDVELAIDSVERLREADRLLQGSFERATQKHA